MRLVNKVILDSEISSKVAWEYKVEPNTFRKWMRIVKADGWCSKKEKTCSIDN